MASNGSIQLGDWGFAIEFQLTIDDVPIVIPNVGTTITFHFERADGSFLDKLGQFSTDGTDGKVRYVVEQGVIQSAGTWRKQVTVSSPTWTRSTTPVAFEVRSNVVTV
jgi:hypothetical protein